MSAEDSGGSVEPERGPEEERMVRFGYYAQMAANQWKSHPAAQVMKDDGYDVEAELWAISRWCYGEGRERAVRLPTANSGMEPCGQATGIDECPACGHDADDHAGGHGDDLDACLISGCGCTGPFDLDRRMRPQTGRS